MGQLIQDWWHVMAGAGTLLSMIGASVYKWTRERRREISRLKHRLGEIEHAHDKHEETCGQRWLALRESTRKLEERIDERHGENVARFDRFDKMLVELLTRNDLRRRPRD